MADGISLAELQEMRGELDAKRAPLIDELRVIDAEILLLNRMINKARGNVRGNGASTQALALEFETNQKGPSRFRPEVTTTDAARSVLQRYGRMQIDELFRHCEPMGIQANPRSFKNILKTKKLIFRFDGDFVSLLENTTLTPSSGDRT